MEAAPLLVSNIDSIEFTPRSLVLYTYPERVC